METLKIRNLKSSSVCVIWNESVDNDIEAFETMAEADIYVKQEKEFDSSYDLSFMWIEDAQARIQDLQD